MPLVADKAIMYLWCFETKEVELKKKQTSGSSLRAYLVGKSKLCKALKLFSLPQQPAKIFNGKFAINRDCEICQIRFVLKCKAIRKPIYLTSKKAS